MKITIYIVLSTVLWAVWMHANAEIIANTNEEVRTIATPILDEILEGIKTNDYAKYTKHFDDVMKEALPKARFLSSNWQIQNLFGQYLSRHYLGFLKKGDMTLVLWKARYDKTDDDVLIKLTISKRGEKYLVTGLFFQ